MEGYAGEGGKSQSRPDLGEEGRSALERQFLGNPPEIGNRMTS